MANIERCHWHRPDEQPPERVVFWRGGINPNLPRWEQEYVRADTLRGAVAALERVEKLCASSTTGMVAISALRDATDARATTSGGQ